eukprot:CAMPEP_0198273980 /NCGR_PEP_ID=MMETSP1447-20131203/58721_1 /TAXON_ID=420782 /ORGANISM="Chaetoceros dichaeta, Strain CCMP1751" /LENGTH=109 /DNA_ID=CAMNT_0043967905 /DNA_START=443 /DNA_END=772 /DNA_ORIENTATION=+
MTRQSKPDMSFFQVFITAITAKEVTSRFGRKASALMTMRRGSQANTGRKGSLVSSNAMLIATQIVQAEESKEEEDEYELEYGHLGIESDPFPIGPCKIDDMGNDPSSNI